MPERYGTRPPLTARPAHSTHRWPSPEVRVVFSRDVRIERLPRKNVLFSCFCHGRRRHPTYIGASLKIVSLSLNWCFAAKKCIAGVAGNCCTTSLQLCGPTVLLQLYDIDKRISSASPVLVFSRVHVLCLSHEDVSAVDVFICPFTLCTHHLLFCQQLSKCQDQMLRRQPRRCTTRR